MPEPVETGKAVVFMVRSTEADQAVAESCLELYNSGHRFCLTSVRFTYSNTQSSLSAQPKPELALARSADNHTVVLAVK